MAWKALLESLECAQANAVVENRTRAQIAPGKENRLGNKKHT